MYLCDRCNTAGFYEENKAEACFHLGIKEAQYDGALEALGRGIKKADGWLWVKNFLKHQKHSELNPLNAVHRGIIRNIREQIFRFSDVDGFRGFVAPIEGLLSLSGNSNSKGNKEKECEKKPSTRPAMGTPEYFDSLSGNPAYAQLDISKEFHKCLAYFSPRDVSHKRFLNWLNRADPAISKNGNGSTKIMSLAEARKRQAEMDAEQERKAHAAQP